MAHINSNLLRGEYHIQRPFYLNGLTYIPAWISKHMSSKVWDEATYRIPNFNRTLKF